MTAGPVLRYFWLPTLPGWIVGRRTQKLVCYLRVALILETAEEMEREATLALEGVKITAS